MLRVALKMLVGDRTKYAGLLFGITFTSFLVAFAASYFCGFITRGFALIAENPSADVGSCIRRLSPPSRRRTCLIRHWTASGALKACCQQCRWP